MIVEPVTAELNMTNNTLSQYFTLHRRYSRSINLERDLEHVDALLGYIPTQRSLFTLQRIFTGVNRAWTLTGVYGKGKSAFAHYLASLCARAEHPLRVKALAIASAALGSESTQYLSLKENLPKQGFFRAVCTGRREPISHTVVRALITGAEIFWHDRKPAVLDKLLGLKTKMTPETPLESSLILELVNEVATAAKTGVFFIIDELGKNLEYAAYNQGTLDLYLLQQLAELPSDTETPVYIVGILHQGFADYGQRLADLQRNEWAKIQGRFEDIPFAESTGQMMRLIGESILRRSLPESFGDAIAKQARVWCDRLKPIIQDSELTADLIEAVYPLHPITALVLPTLCHRYAQNDRSLFTFLTSSEPYSFKNFLEETSLSGSRLPTLQLDRVYDYFIEAARFASRPNHQRWVEIQDLIADARHLPPDYVRVLKAIGILNLVTITGATKATRDIVKLSICDKAEEPDGLKHWDEIIDGLLHKNLITHRRQLGELRIWQGSDFNVDRELKGYLERERSPLKELLSSLRPLKPKVAQRHSYTTGTLRYFERIYLDASVDLTELKCLRADSDGLVGYWVDCRDVACNVSTTADGKPLILVSAAKLDLLGMRVRELAALKKMQTTAAELQSDGVARREVRALVVKAEQLLDEALTQAFSFAGETHVCWIEGKQETIRGTGDFNAKLSAVCDRIYHQSPVINNELINRRELTNVGAKARRKLIEAMWSCWGQKKLGLTGYGPEVSMYFSLLGDTTKIHRKKNGHWGFYPPKKTQFDTNLRTLWDAIEQFCLSAKDKPKTLDKLYEILAAPPYGVKQGAIPVILTAVLFYHRDDVGVYKDGTFLPVLGSEHFELLVKDPSRFAVKYFEVAGLRTQVFEELEVILAKPRAKKSAGLRNATLLNVVTPLYKFVNKLPAYTRKSKSLSKEARAVLGALDKTVEPDELLFTALPVACNLAPIRGEEDDGTVAKTLKKELVEVLREVNTAYEGLLSNCTKLLYDAFGVRRDLGKLREDLRVRALCLAGKCVTRSLRRFVVAAVDDTGEDRGWLEALLMVIGDKPAESWTDEDVIGFEMNLSDLARRFKNLEALQQEVGGVGEGVEARRIAVTRPDGGETHCLVWVDHRREDEIEGLVERVLEDPLLKDNIQLQQAFVAKLTEKVLGSDVDSPH